MHRYPYQETTTTRMLRQAELAADAGALRPEFGVDFLPVGAEKFKQSKKGTAIEGTFLDLISPDYSTKDEKAYMEQQRAALLAAKRAGGDFSRAARDTDDDDDGKRTRISGGNPRNSFTFKGIHSLFHKHVYDTVYASLPSDMRAPKAVDLSEESVKKFFSPDGPFSSAYTYIRVSQVGKDFLVSLPIDVISPITLLETAREGMQTPLDQRAFTKRVHEEGFPRVLDALKAWGLDLNKSSWKYTIAKSKVGTSLPGRYSKVNAFYNTYAKSFTLYDSALVARPNKSSLLDEVDLAPNYSKMARKLVACVDLLLPGEEAQYFVQTSANKITPAQLLAFFSNWYIKGVRAHNFPTYVHSMETVITKSAPYKPHVKVNREGLALTRDNALLYLPREVNNVTSYTEAFEQTSRDVDGSATYCHTQLTKFPRNQLLYVDWVNQKLVYTGEYAQILVEDLDSNHVFPASSYVASYSSDFIDSLPTISAIMKLTEKLNKALSKRVPKSMYDYFQDSPTAQQAYLKDYLYSINPLAYNKSLGSTFPLESSGFVDYLRGLSTFVALANNDYSHRTRENLTPEDLVFLNAHPLRMKDIFTGQHPAYAPLQFWIKSIQEAVTKDSDWMAVINGNPDYSPVSTMGEIACFKVVAAFANITALQEEAQKAAAPYLDQDNGLTSFIPKLKNAQGLEGLQPHQRKVAGALAKHPKFAIVAVQAGGGKTILAIQDILNCLEDKFVTKPLVLCPSHLVKDYVAECNYVSLGKINTIVFDTAIFNEYCKIENSKPPQFDFSKLRALCDSAPINTIFLCGYDTISRNAIYGVYGSVTEPFLPKMEFLRSLGFDGVWMDESHNLKSDKSLRTTAIESLIVDISVKRLLTGTIVPNTLKDLVRQIGLLAPNVLGNLAQFEERFFEVLRDDNGKRIKGADPVPKQGAEKEIRDFIKRNATYINIQRKEWQAALPKLREFHVPLHLTQAQQEVYDAIMREEVDKIEASIGRQGSFQTVGDEDEDDDLADVNVDAVFEDDSVESDEMLERIMERVGKNLSIVESFLANPKAVAQGAHLTGLDAISPKAQGCIDILEKHLHPLAYYKQQREDFKSYTQEEIQSEPSLRESYEEMESALFRLENPNSPEAKAKPVYPGKILIFCNTHLAVQGIYDALPPKFKNVTLKYEASKKADHESIFRNDDSVRVLVGVSKSLEEGLNLQMADTLIRVDNVWTPGAMEQGMSRINRPNFKGQDFRKEIFVYSLLVDGTIDVLKTAKLASKTVTVSKFYAAGTEDEWRYRDLGIDPDTGKQIQPLKISWKRLRQGLRFEELAPYQRAYIQMRSIDRDIAEEWRKAQPLDSLKPVPVVHTGILEGSKRMRRVPYTAGMSLFNANELGLIPYNIYKRTKEEEFRRKYPKETFNWDPDGISIHTSNGDGVVRKELSEGRRLSVELTNGIKLPVRASAAFVVTKQSTSTLEIFDQIAQATGLEVVDVQLEAFREAKKLGKLTSKQSKKEIRDRLRAEKRQRREEKRLSKEGRQDPRDVVRRDSANRDEIFEDNADRETNEIQLHATRINDMLAVVLPSDDPDGDFVTFAEYGFIVTPIYQWAAIRTPKILDQVLDGLIDLNNKGSIEFQQKDVDRWNEVYEEFKRNKQFAITPTMKSTITNFLIERPRAFTNPVRFRPEPLVVNHQLYFCIDMSKHRNGKNTVNAVKRMGAKFALQWKSESPDLMMFAQRKSEVVDLVRTLKSDGWNITNMKEFTEEVESFIAKGKKADTKDATTKKPKTKIKVVTRDKAGSKAPTSKGKVSLKDAVKKKTGKR